MPPGNSAEALMKKSSGDWQITEHRSAEGLIQTSLGLEGTGKDSCGFSEHWTALQEKESERNGAKVCCWGLGWCIGSMAVYINGFRCTHKV